MNDTKNKKIEFIYKILVIVLFAIGTLYVAHVHEPWSDEAQSFLIARDNSIKEIFYYSKFEGTLPLWFLLIKFFILFRRILRNISSFTNTFYDYRSNYL